MASYLVHVLLHKAKLWGDYDKLHDAMEADGFVKWVMNDKGVKRKLPPAEYAYHDEQEEPDCQEVLKLAKAAATTTGHTFAVFVGEWSGKWAGHGLTDF